jgi:predicted dinucleotide-binding enzyme
MPPSESPLNLHVEPLQPLPGRAPRIVKAFNTTFAGTLLKGEVAGLVQSGGMHGIDVGGLQRARQLEALGLLGYVVQGPLGLGFMSSWKLIR